ncbi:NAD(P)H-hydrate dehydratase [Candidatus Sumerlaeota bacterium]|nr:NAD(P)H-hydrate dehydratase [Candidatus Sumerlaeota bacterium]
MKIVTAAEMREIDRIAIQERGINGSVLMDRAGKALTREIMEHFKPSSVCIVTGRGNNAGDGFVAAHYLHEAGVKVHCACLCGMEELTGDALTHYVKMDSEIKVTDIKSASQLSGIFQEQQVIVDALLGTGAKGAPRGIFGEAIDEINRARKTVVAADIPSGLPADGGDPEGACVLADLTVCMGLPKMGMMIYPGIEACGRLVIDSIGFPDDLMQDSSFTDNLIDPGIVRDVLPVRQPNSHKGTYGRVMVIAGSRGMTGAAIFCSRGAMRAGAGLVYVAVKQSLNPIMEISLPQALTIPMPGEQSGALDAACFDLLKGASKTMDVIALGPGMSQAPGTQELILRLLEVEKPLVLDADGLNALQGDMSPLKRRKAPTVVTPHPGELSRMIGRPVDEIQRHRLEVARQFAQEHQVHMVLKGERTVVADPNGEVFINPTGNTALAQGGSGDVLTGMIAGLLAQNCTEREASLIAVYIHGLAAELAAKVQGERGAVVEDILAHIGPAFLRVEKGE